MNHYFGAIEPFSIMFDENDIAYLQSNLLHVDEERLSVKKKQDNQTYILKIKWIIQYRIRFLIRILTN